MRRLTLICAAALLTQACATVADDPSPVAWANATADVRTAFDSARSGEQAAFLEQALAAALVNGRVFSQDCLVHRETLDQARTCRAVIMADGHRIDTDAVGDKLAADADKLAAYGSAMARLAASRDIADQRTALNTLGKSAGDIFALAGVPGVEAVTGLVSGLAAQSRLDRRREALSRIAAATQPAIDALAVRLQAETTLLQTNIILARSETVARLQARLLDPAVKDQERIALTGHLLGAIQAEHDAAGARIDFTALPEAHRRMVASLRQPRMTVKAALDGITALTGAVANIRSALKSAATPTP